jgi:hypothetical protein
MDKFAVFISQLGLAAMFEGCEVIVWQNVWQSDKKAIYKEIL